MAANGVVCDLFSLSMRVEGEMAHFSCRTDLPPGAQVIILAKRKYRMISGQELVWDGYGETLLVQPELSANIASATFSIIESDRTARREFDRIHRGPRDRLASRVSDELTVTAIVGARQRLKMFGRNNVNLTGARMILAGEIHVVQDSVSVLAPMLDSLHPAM